MQPLCDDFFKEVAAPAGPSSMHLNPAVRAYLGAVRDHVIGHHDRGVAERRVNEEHSDLLDRLIRKLFRLAEDRYFEHFARLDFRLAVIAVGGYGRRELSLASDVDLLFLHAGKLNPYVETIAEAITHRLWDAKLTVGVATRTLRDSLRIGAGDLSTLTSYFDARFLIGDPELYADFEGRVRELVGRDAMGYVQAKLSEQRARHERFGESLYLLQPNVKESVGALRDYHTAAWVARAVRWEARSPSQLHVQGFIDEGELEDLETALDFLWRVRNELHRDGRKDDRLHYAAQEKLALAFGYTATEESLAIEQFMRDYYLHARTLERVNRRVTDHASRLLERRRRRRDAPSHPVAEGFALVDGQLEIPGPGLLRERPARMLAAFAVAQHHDVDLSPRAERLLQQNLDLVDDAFRNDPEAADYFMRILRAPARVYRAVKAMSELGLLGAYLPEFGRLVGMWTHDHYHTYTVDVHSLFLIEQLRRIWKGNFGEELALPTSLARQTPDHSVLFLSCICHDIGKGQGGGHSAKGAEQVGPVCARLGFDDAATETVRFLVQHHLTMSGMAERRDVHDPRTILRLADLAGSRERLRLLYLLTVADIRSVSAEAWTSWKAGLLEALYRNSAEWLEAGEAEEGASRYFMLRAKERFEAAEREVGERLARTDVDGAAADRLLASMPRRYLLQHAPSEVTEVVTAALSFLASDRAIGVATFQPPIAGTPFWGLVIFARDRPGLFSHTAGVLASLGHDILAAQAYTTREALAVDMFEVRPPAGGAEEEAHEVARIEERLGLVLSGELDVDDLLSRRRNPLPQNLRSRPPTVTVSNDESDLHTIIDVRAPDRPALLHDIAGALARAGVDVGMSRVSTRAGRAIDSFWVTEKGERITDASRVAQIQDAVLAAIGQGA